MEYDTESIDSLSCQESVDLDYLREMYQYQINAKKETDSIEMSMEEENQIICKIKEDILNQVRNEMGSELDKYHLKTDRTNATTDTLLIEPYDDMDPIIRKGLYQIKKLDKILLRKMQREKEVKRERILLQKRLREELNELESNNKQLSKEVKTNVMKFLALKLPIRHNEGMNEDTAEDEIPKLFQTEINHEFDSTTSSCDRLKQPSTEASSGIHSAQSKKTSNSKRHISHDESENITGNGSGTTGMTKEKNFIKRNIELASKASEPIPLTDCEKMRLEYLLADIDTDTNVDAHENRDNFSLMSRTEENPFQMVTLDNYSGTILPPRSENGFQSALSVESDIASIQYQLSVESRLKMYMGDENYKQLSKIDEKSIFAESLSYQIPQSTDIEIDIERLGEHSLKEVKFSRETQKRLTEIDENLLKLKDSAFVDELEERALQILSNSSRNAFSRSNFSSASDSSGELYLAEIRSESNSEFKVERLSQNILDDLLREARSCGINHKRLNSITEMSETDESVSNTNSRDVEFNSRLNSPEAKTERTSRFPDINLYRQMTSPAPKF